jgi:exosortase
MRDRVLSWTPLAIAGAAAAALYAPVVAGLVTQWVTDATSSHGVLLVIAAALVLRRRWPAIRALPLEPANAGFALLALALIVYLVGTLTGDVFVLRVSIPVAAAGCILALCGRQHARRALAPLALLVLAIPLPSVVVTQLTLPLQLMSSQVAAGAMSASGMHVVREGNLLTLPHITLQVADACSGLRSLVSVVAVSAGCISLLSLSARRAVLLMAVAVPIAVIGNGLRVAATGFLTAWIGEIAVRGTLHDLTGYVAFLGMCGAIVGVLLATRPRPATAIERAIEREPLIEASHP